MFVCDEDSVKREILSEGFEREKYSSNHMEEVVLTRACGPLTWQAITL
jgi:hypothetical protein